MKLPWQSLADDRNSRRSHGSNPRLHTDDLVPNPRLAVDLLLRQYHPPRRVSRLKKNKKDHHAIVMIPNEECHSKHVCVQYTVRCCESSIWPALWLIPQRTSSLTARYFVTSNWLCISVNEGDTMAAALVQERNFIFI